MSVRARMIRRHDEEPSRRGKRIRGEELEDGLLVPIADAVRLARVFERLTDAQEPRATLLLTPRTHYAHRCLIRPSHTSDDPARSAVAVPSLRSREVAYLSA